MLSVGGGRVGGVSQAYNWLSTTHTHITDCKLDSLVHASVSGCGSGELIWTCFVWAE